MDSSPVTVLILEPDNALRDLVSLALRREGYQVVTATDWMDAMGLLQQHRPQVMLLAGLLPLINGIDFLRYCKSQGWIEQTAVILISALGYREIVHKAKASGAADFLVKPVDIGVLLDKVKKFSAQTGGKSTASGSEDPPSSALP